MNPEKPRNPSGDDFAEVVMDLGPKLESLLINYENTEGENNSCVFNLINRVGGLVEMQPKISNLRFSLDIPNTPEMTIVGTLDDGLGEIYKEYDKTTRRNSSYGLCGIIDMHSGDVKESVRNSGNFFPDSIYKGHPLLLVAYDYSTSRFSEDVIWPILLGFTCKKEVWDE